VGLLREAIGITQVVHGGAWHILPGNLDKVFEGRGESGLEIEE
jgi:hypothetical protein